MRVAVIGSGLGGLSAACTLAARGYEVEVFEKNPWLGGKAAVLEEQGFRFDMGPTILIQPSVLRRIFCEAGRTMSDYLEMVRLDPQWRCFFDDGTVLDLKDNVREMAASLEGREPGLGGRFTRVHGTFRKAAHHLRQVLLLEVGRFHARHLRYRRKLPDFGAQRCSEHAPGAKRLRNHSRVHQGSARGPDARSLRAIRGSSPDNSPAILCSIGHMQAEQGIWYPKGGTRAVPQALVRLGTELGVRYHTSIEIARLLTEGGAISGLETSSGEQHRLRRRGFQ